MAAAMDDLRRELPDTLRDAYQRACGMIAPTWPLDQFIAVNPFWEMRDKSAAEVAARLAALVGAETVMPSSYYAELENSGVEARHLDAAAKELGLDAKAIGYDDGEANLPHWHNISDLLDSCDYRPSEMAWRDEIIHQLSQFCADAMCEARDGLEKGRLFERWLDSVRHDHGIAILMGEKGLPAQFDRLPNDADTLLSIATAELGVTDAAAELYAHALLLDVNGWASWLAYLRWQEGLGLPGADLMQDLLAIRMAWELALWRHIADKDAATARRIQFSWQQQVANPAPLLADHERQQQRSWLWQRATELAYQESLAAMLCDPGHVEIAEFGRRKLQAVFCIDVRSEPFRRHLEAQDEAIRTLGFAGFFGLPLEYRPRSSEFSRPQLPGLLAPQVEVTEQDNRSRKHDMHQRARWAELGNAPLSMFGLVESSGPLYVLQMLKNGFFPGRQRRPVDSMHDAAPLCFNRDGEPLSLEERTDLAESALRSMGMTGGFARTVMLVGHGSSSRNNPHASSLDCGACGGQTGSVNSRALAELLNDFDVRGQLQRRGIMIPAVTCFFAALHDTTTDEVRVLDERHPLPDHVREWLDAAGEATRRERAANLGLAADNALASKIDRRSRDWSELRPEWGLAGNAAFIAAPRELTRGLDLGGRVFLHDYDWKTDTDHSVLQLIMTAPMVVANWINTQYNASVADNVRYGSGNKMLHNVVGGNIGVFEGNGGDLRIGLPWQSVHDGERFMHVPQRLSVYIAAPAEAIQRVYAEHDVVRELVDRDWLFLFRIDEDRGVARLYRDEWLANEAGTVSG